MPVSEKKQWGKRDQRLPSELLKEVRNQLNHSMEGDPHILCYLASGERKFSKFMSEPTKKIDLIEDADASGEVAEVYDEWRAKSGRQQMPGILKCFSHRPDFLREVMRFSDTVHFSAGHLDRRTKEAIASWVSWLNRCPY